MRLEDCSLRSLLESDLDRVLAWRNSDRVRKKMLSSNTISLDEHRAWFARLQNDSTQSHLVFEYLEKPYGLVYVIVREPESGAGDWGFYIGEVHRPLGCGTAMGILGLDYFFTKMGILIIRGHVLNNNEGSQQYHHRLGFRETARDKNLIIFTLTKDEWARRRPEVVQALGARTANKI